jgi:uncharacterized membrane-anchored protein
MNLLISYSRNALLTISRLFPYSYSEESRKTNRPGFGLSFLTEILRIFPLVYMLNLLRVIIARNLATILDSYYRLRSAIVGLLEVAIVFYLSNKL